MAKKYVLLYESPPEERARTPLYFDAHVARGNAFHERGELILYGPFTEHGAMAVFRTREAAEAFAKDDPFVVNGIVHSWEIREWLEAFEG
jgi:uncharacterized protein YciI